MTYLKILNKNNNSNFSHAFTLAEISVILGIIGIISTLTMPALIANHKKHEVETRLKKFYS